MVETSSSKAIGGEIQTPHSLTAKTKKAAWWRKLTLIGPGALIAVGYIDPGNWATDIAGGAYAGYALLSIVFASSLIAMLLQVMSARLGIATGKDLAQLSREVWPKFALPAWIAAELTIMATDLAEVIGAAIALKLLFDIPIAIGVVMTTLDVFLMLALDKRKSRLLERIIVSFLFIIACGLLYELSLSQPIMKEILQGFVPTQRLVFDPQLLFLAIGVIGATIMPHNLYLHSNLVIKDRSNDLHKAAMQATCNTIISLGGAMLLNIALVILAASTFHHNGHLEITALSDAHRLFTPLLGTSVSAIIFAIMLLVAGQSASITGTLAGQVVMAGYIKLHIKPWLRRLITRLLAIIPAIIVIAYCGESSTTMLLVGSQVFLSLQLPLAMLALLLLTSNTSCMGDLVNRRWMRYIGWVFGSLIVVANLVLLLSLFRDFGHF